MGLENLEKPISQDKRKERSEDRADFIFENPEITSYTRINYPLPEYKGRELKPGR